jgi:hypothetical protein
MHRTLLITIAALSFLGATAAGAQTIARSQLAQDNYVVRPNSQIYQTYLPGQGGCVDDNGFGMLQPCGD